FKNADLNQFCELKGIKREFSVPRTPQQNGIAERMNMTLIEATRTMLADLLLPIPFWAEAVNTACYVQNRVLVTKPHNKTPYELLHGRLPSIGFMRPFGCPVTILNTLDPLGKFQGKVDEGILVGYYVCSKALGYLIVEPVLFRKLCMLILWKISQMLQVLVLLGFQDTEKVGEEGTQTYVLFLVLSNGFTNPKNNKDAHTNGKEHDDDIQKSVSPDIYSLSCGDLTREQGDKDENKDKGKSPVVTITGFKDLNEEFTECFNNSSNEVNAVGSLVSAAGLNFTNSTNDFSAVGPSNATMPNLEDLSHNTDDVGAEVDINNMESIILVSLIPTTRIHKDHPTSQIIGHTQEEGIEYEEVFAPVARIETIRLFLAYASFMGFPVYQMDVKQKKDGIFISQDKYIAKILKKFGLSEGKSASTPIDAEKPLLKDLDGEDVDVHTYRSVIGSLMYLTSSRPDIMFAVCACARFQVTLKLLHLNAVKRIFRYLKGKSCLGLWYLKDSPFDLVAYSDSDYAGASLDRKSTTGGC
nr:ribonuclease H-like domain-containing protein [Tanacetum cinerariifolium]